VKNYPCLGQKNAHYASPSLPVAFFDEHNIAKEGSSTWGQKKGIHGYSKPATMYPIPLVGEGWGWAVLRIKTHRKWVFWFKKWFSFFSQGWHSHFMCFR